ncbi:MAG: hypothetical protein OK442_08340 [Thaumarchaeota archaeon]|nr:hypothetical protein [Nitrososphaerota archaeon]
MSGPRLFYIDGVRHSALVVASSGEEAVKLAVEASSSGKGDAKVLFGQVGEWESPRAIELKLPKGLELVETQSQAS